VILNGERQVLVSHRGEGKEICAGAARIARKPRATPIRTRSRASPGARATPSNTWCAGVARAQSN
jgi:hypothetical protein